MSYFGSITVMVNMCFFDLLSRPSYLLIYLLILYFHKIVQK